MIFVVGGGGGLNPNKPLIHVNAPVGSTVDFTLSGIVVKSIPSAKAFPNVDGTSADYYYSAANGTYTVTATLSGDTASETVSVSTAKQYDVKLDYATWIFKEGVGAVVALSSASQQNSTVYTNLTSYIDVTRTQRGYAVSKIWTTNTFDVTELNHLYVDMVITGVYDVGVTMQYNPVFCVSDNLASRSVDSTNEFSALLKHQFTDLAARQTYSFDVSNISGSHYVGFFGCLEGKIYNIYGTED